MSEKKPNSENPLRSSAPFHHRQPPQQQQQAKQRVSNDHHAIASANSLPRDRPPASVSPSLSSSLSSVLFWNTESSSPPPSNTAGGGSGSSTSTATPSSKNAIFSRMSELFSGLFSEEDSTAVALEKTTHSTPNASGGEDVKASAGSRALSAAGRTPMKEVHERHGPPSQGSPATRSVEASRPAAVAPHAAAPPTPTPPTPAFAFPALSFPSDPSGPHSLESSLSSLPVASKMPPAAPGTRSLSASVAVVAPPSTPSSVPDKEEFLRGSKGRTRVDDAAQKERRKKQLWEVERRTVEVRFRQEWVESYQHLLFSPALLAVLLALSSASTPAHPFMPNATVPRPLTSPAGGRGREGREEEEGSSWSNAEAGRHPTGGLSRPSPLRRPDHAAVSPHAYTMEAEEASGGGGASPPPPFLPSRVRRATPPAPPPLSVLSLQNDPPHGMPSPSHGRIGGRTSSSSSSSPSLAGPHDGDIDPSSADTRRRGEDRYGSPSVRQWATGGGGSPQSAAFRGPSPRLALSRSSFFLLPSPSAGLSFTVPPRRVPLKELRELSWCKGCPEGYRLAVWCVLTGYYSPAMQTKGMLAFFPTHFFGVSPSRLRLAVVSGVVEEEDAGGGGGGGGGRSPAMPRASPTLGWRDWHVRAFHTDPNGMEGGGGTTALSLSPTAISTFSATDAEDGLSPSFFRPTSPSLASACLVFPPPSVVRRKRKEYLSIVRSFYVEISHYHRLLQQQQTNAFSPSRAFSPSSRSPSNAWAGFPGSMPVRSNRNGNGTDAGDRRSPAVSPSFHPSPSRRKGPPHEKLQKDSPSLLSLAAAAPTSSSVQEASAPPPSSSSVSSTPPSTEVSPSLSVPATPPFVSISPVAVSTRSTSPTSSRSSTPFSACSCNASSYSASYSYSYSYSTSSSSSADDAALSAEAPTTGGKYRATMTTGLAKEGDEFPRKRGPPPIATSPSSSALHAPDHQGYPRPTCLHTSFSPSASPATTPRQAIPQAPSPAAGTMAVSGGRETAASPSSSSFPPPSTLPPTTSPFSAPLRYEDPQSREGKMRQQIWKDVVRSQFGKPIMSQAKRGATAAASSSPASFPSPSSAAPISMTTVVPSGTPVVSLAGRGGGGGGGGRPPCDACPTPTAPPPPCLSSPPIPTKEGTAASSTAGEKAVRASRSAGALVAPQDGREGKAAPPQPQAVERPEWAQSDRSGSSEASSSRRSTVRTSTMTPPSSLAASTTTTTPRDPSRSPPPHTHRETSPDTPLRGRPSAPLHVTMPAGNPQDEEEETNKKKEEEAHTGNGIPAVSLSPRSRSTSSPPPPLSSSRLSPSTEVDPPPPPIAVSSPFCFPPRARRGTIAGGMDPTLLTHRKKRGDDDAEEEEEGTGQLRPASERADGETLRDAGGGEGSPFFHPTPTPTTTTSATSLSSSTDAAIAVDFSFSFSPLPPARPRRMTTAGMAMEHSPHSAVLSPDRFEEKANKDGPTMERGRAYDPPRTSSSSPSLSPLTTFPLPDGKEKWPSRPLPDISFSSSVTGVSSSSSSSSSSSCNFLRHPRVLSMMERLLLCWALRHPASGYVQGMNDLIVPFVAVILAQHACPTSGSVTTLLQMTSEELDAALCVKAIPESVWFGVLEPDAYWLSSHVRDLVQGHFTQQQQGFMQMLGALDDLIQAAAPALHAHLSGLGVETSHYAFRWMTCLLCRELQPWQILRLLDAYLSCHVVGGEVEDENVLTAMHHSSAAAAGGGGGDAKSLLLPPLQRGSTAAGKDREWNKEGGGRRGTPIHSAHPAVGSHAYRTSSVSSFAFPSSPFKKTAGATSEHFGMGQEKTFLDYHVYTCAAFLFYFSSKLMRMNDFGETMSFLLDLPTETITSDDMDALLSEAFLLKSIWAERLRLGARH